MGEVTTAELEFNRHDKNQNVTVETAVVTIMTTSYVMCKIGEWKY